MNKNEIPDEFEYYALFKNVDESILKINSLIKKDGYEFVAFELSDIEKDFYKLYSFPKNIQSKRYGSLMNGITISSEFYDVYQKHIFGDIFSSKVIFLKHIQKISKDIDDNFIESKMLKFKNELIRKLRYFKNGDIMSPTQFKIIKESRQIISQLSEVFSKSPFKKKFILKDEEIDDLKNHLNQELESNKLTETAEMYFESYYYLDNKKAKFTILFFALESIFNISSQNPITHIIARHLSLIISKDKNEFDSNYTKIKELYNLRSNIVHGSDKIKLDKIISEKIDELSDLTRKSIIYCMNNELKESKIKNVKELFNYLNSKGFS